MLKMSWELLQKRLSLVAITAMIGPSGMSANLMEKGLDPCLDPSFETKLDDIVSKYTILGHGKKSNQVLLRSLSQEKTQHDCLLKLITTRQRNV